MRSPLRILIVVLLVVCSATLRLSAQTVVDPDERSKILALEHAWNRAAESKDLKTLDKLLDNAFVNVDFDGRLMTKADVLADVKASPVVQVVSEAMVAQLHGSTAMVTGIYRMMGVRDGRQFLRRGRFIDTWVRHEGQWICIASQVTPILGKAH